MSAPALEIILTGTGYPRPDPKRAGPGCLVVAGDKRLQFDCGRDTVRRLATLGIAPAQLDALFFTHYHSDHLTDLADMAMTRWWFGRNEPPLAFRGPTGLNERLSDIEEFLRADAKRRAEHGNRTDAFVVSGEEFERPCRGQTPCVYEDGGVRVLTAAVEHGNVDEAVAYRVEHDGRAVAISGDCSYSPSLVELARGADLLVHEIISPELLIDRIGAAAHSIIEYHSTGEEVARVAREAGVARLVLTHLVPGPRDADEEAHFIDAVARHYSGEVTLGEDLLRFRLPSVS